MAAKRKVASTGDLVELLEKQLIVTLGLEGVPQRSIREVVECDLNRVTRIVKHLKRKGAKGDAADHKRIGQIVRGVTQRRRKDSEED